MNKTFATDEEVNKRKSQDHNWGTDFKNEKYPRDISIELNSTSLLSGHS